MMLVSDIGTDPFADFERAMLSNWGYSSVTSIAISGQLVWASQALSSRPGGTEPSPCSCALPNSSRSNSSGASDLQRAWPWHLSWSTWIFSFPAISVFPRSRSGLGQRGLLPRVYVGGATLLWTPISYSILHSRRAPTVKPKDCHYRDAPSNRSQAAQYLSPRRSPRRAGPGRAERGGTGRSGSDQHQGPGEATRRIATGAVSAFCRPRGAACGRDRRGLAAILRHLARGDREAVEALETLAPGAGHARFRS